MYWTLLAVKDGVIKGFESRQDVRQIRLASGLGLYEGDTVTIIRASQDTPDFQPVNPGDKILLHDTLAIAPKHSPVWMDDVAEVIAIPLPIKIQISKVLPQEDKLKVMYRVEKTEISENFTAQEKVDFLAQYPGCTVIHFGLIWLISKSNLAVSGEGVVERKSGKEPDGIVYY